jgi:hypothetical protein
VEKYDTARQGTDDNIMWPMRFASWITKATHTLRISNTYCFSIATILMRTRLYVTFIIALPVLLKLKKKS